MHIAQGIPLPASHLIYNGKTDHFLIFLLKKNLERLLMVSENRRPIGSRQRQQEQYSRSFYIWQVVNEIDEISAAR